MSAPSYRFAPFSASFDLTGFDCGHEAYNQWLRNSAEAAVRAGSAGVYPLLAETPAASRVVGYYAIAPTAVVRAELPRAAAGGAPDPVPGFLLAKLALDRALRGDRHAMWGTQLVVAALRRIIEAADLSGGRVIVVDVDNADLVPFYRGNSFLPTKADPLRLYMKVATARKLIDDYDEG